MSILKRVARFDMKNHIFGINSPIALCWRAESLDDLPRGFQAIKPEFNSRLSFVWILFEMAEDFPKTEEVSTKVEVPDSGSNSIHSDAEAERRAFLSTFSPEEDKAVRRKVDYRFLWLIGLMYIIENVSGDRSLIQWLD